LGKSWALLLGRLLPIECVYKQFGKVIETASARYIEKQSRKKGSVFFGGQKLDSLPKAERAEKKPPN